MFQILYFVILCWINIALTLSALKMVIILNIVSWLGRNILLSFLLNIVVGNVNSHWFYSTVESCTYSLWKVLYMIAGTWKPRCGLTEIGPHVTTVTRKQDVGPTNYQHLQIIRMHAFLWSKVTKRETFKE